MTTSLMTPDLWLSDIFGYPVWKIEELPCEDLLPRLKSEVPVFAYAKISASNITSISRLIKAGFAVVDVALTFEVEKPALDHISDTVRLALPKDRVAVTRIASTAFQGSRFHIDPLVPNNIANTIKAAWAGNYFTGNRGDGMVIAEYDGCVVGFLQLMWTKFDFLVIDLIAVDRAHQGQGVGRNMIGYAAQNGVGDGRIPAGMIVGTQVSNTHSVRLYESLGFRLVSGHYVLHFHA